MKHARERPAPELLLCRIVDSDEEQPRVGVLAGFVTEFHEVVEQEVFETPGRAGVGEKHADEQDEGRRPDRVIEPPLAGSALPRV